MPLGMLLECLRGFLSIVFIVRRMDKLGAVCFITLVLFVSRILAQACSSNTNCTDCLMQGCKWCRNPVDGGSPICMDKTETQGCNFHLPLGMSGIRILENRPDLLVAPQKMRINIEYGTPFVVDLHIRIPKYVGKQNKLLLKVKDVKDYDQTLTAPGHKSRSFRKRNGQYFLMKNLKADSTIKLLYNVSATSCEKTKNQRAKLIARFSEKGNKKAKKVKVKVLLRKLECPCNCPVQFHEVDSPRCSGNGNMECGVCKCNEGYTGRSCELSLIEHSEMELQCIPPNGTRVCSGRGECIAGYCNCHTRRQGSIQKYSGRYCQCDDYSCSYHNNQICGGHGRCTCGQCQCFEGYDGEACECPTSPATCMTSDGKLCNEAGECVCGVCRCDPTLLYKGPTCEDCPTCPGKCRQIKDCVLCMGFASGPLTRDECFERCEQYNIVTVVYLLPILDGAGRMCQFRDDDDCIFKFTYRYEYGRYTSVEVQQTRECPSLQGLVLPEK